MKLKSMPTVSPCHPLLWLSRFWNAHQFSLFIFII